MGHFFRSFLLGLSVLAANFDDNKKMGARQGREKGRNIADSGQINLDEKGSRWQESVEVQQCCGISMQRVTRRQIVWENNFIENCRLIGEEFVWARDMIELLTNCELDKKKYIREMLALTKDQRMQTGSQTEILHTQAEVDKFRHNLKKSVILSFASSQSSQSSQSHIASMIEARPSRARINIERSAYLNRDGKGNPPLSPKAISMVSKGSFRRSVISLLDDTISSVMGADREVTQQSARDLEVFLKFSMLLERHLGDVGCMLGRVKRLFVLYMEKTYRDPEVASLRMGDFTDDIKQFLVVLREAVVDYYGLGSFGDQQPNLFLANQENILSACTAVLFKDPTFYGQVFATVNHYCSTRQASFATVLKQLEGSTPERFLVKDKFCLNSKTIESYIQSISTNSPEAAMIESLDLKQFMQSTTIQQPYRYCIEQIRELAKTKSPISKMKAIVNCSESISNEIENFYQKNGLRKEKWMLDADQVLSIFCYILVHAQVPNLLSHIFILENFATSHQMISIGGYYLSVINCAIQQLENEHPQAPA